MKRTIHNFVQGSPEWMAYRATPNQFNASDAPAMLGESPYKSRDQLLHEMATGIKPDINAQTQMIFDQGHRFESEDRPRAEAFIGMELYPATVSLDMGGFKLSASLDGWTMCESIIYEHKTKNKTIIEMATVGDIAAVHRIQIEQQLIVAGADKCLFTGSLGENDDSPIRIWYESDPALREILIAGWKQFAIDLANYVAPEAQAPKAIAQPVAALPSINYEIDLSKGITIHSNLDAFKLAAQELVEKSKDLLVTDQDFEDAKARIKECEKAESNIKSLIERVLGELGDADTFKRDLESIGGWIRQSRLNQDKQVKTRSAERKAEIINAGKVAVQEHIAELNALLKTVSMPNVPVDFEAAVYRKSSFDSMQSGVNDAIAAFKIEANRISGAISKNLELMREIASDYKFLFSDMQQLCTMDGEALRAIALRRIEDHKAAEEKRLEAERERIRKEEADRIQREHDAEQARITAAKAKDERDAQAAQLQAGPSKEIKGEIVMRASAMNLEPVQNIETSFTKAERDHASVTTEQNYDEPMVDLSDYQKGRRDGIIAGLDLALQILAKHGAKDFAKVLEDFIEIGVPESITKAA